MPPVLPSFPSVSHGVKLNTKRHTTLSENVINFKNVPLSKRKADESPPKKQMTKRPALINVTNNGKSLKVHHLGKNEKTSLEKNTTITRPETRAKSKTRLSENRTSNVINVTNENKTKVAKQNVKKTAETSTRVDAMMPVLKNLSNNKTAKLSNILSNGKKSAVSKPRGDSSFMSNMIVSKPKTRSSLVTGVKLPSATTKNKLQKDVVATSLAAIPENEARCSKLDKSLNRIQTRLCTQIATAEKVKLTATYEKPCSELDPSLTRRQTRLSTSTAAVDSKAKLAVAREESCSNLDTSLTRRQTKLSTSTAAVDSKAKLAVAREEPCSDLDTSLTRRQTRLSTSIYAAESKAKLTTAREKPCSELDTSLTRRQTRLSTSIAITENKTKLSIACEEPCVELNTSMTRMQTRLSTSIVAAENKAKQEAKEQEQKNSLITLKEDRTSISENRVMTRFSSRRSLAEKSLTTSGSLYMSALEDPADESIEKKEAAKKKLLDSLSEFDKELINDPFQVSLYAMEIFEYLKSREAHFPITDYISRQSDITEQMRAMLVDWMAEVQENFELNHETLYLAVKLVDLYLDKVKIDRSSLQLLGAAAIFLACKYDERLSPAMDDFVYVSDGAYDHDGLLEMEQRILKIVNYELSIPISYSFLRRYARCARIQMPMLTLARFILELGLMSYKTILLSDSKQAAAALYLARKMSKNPGWNDSLVYYTGYKLSDFKDIVILFNEILHEKPSKDLQSIRTKYSHKVFFHVAKTSLLKTEELDLDS